MIKNGAASRAVRDTVISAAGSLLFAVGLDCFELPNGLAAGGVSGIATIIFALGQRVDVYIPVGLQTIAMNIVLLALVVRQRDRRYLAKTVEGILFSGLFTDILQPIVPVLGEGELLLCALWGGVITGVGLGLVFLAGGNTGGTDIIAQLLTRRTGIAVGTMMVAVDGAIVLASAPVFSVENALYAAIAMYISGRAVDTVVDGPRAARAVYIISQKHERIAQGILHSLDRGCTQLEATGVYSKAPRPVLMCVLGRSETTKLKDLVAEIDPDAIVIIAEVHEVFGEGFRRLED